MLSWLVSHRNLPPRRAPSRSVTRARTRVADAVDFVARELGLLTQVTRGGSGSRTCRDDRCRRGRVRGRCREWGIAEIEHIEQSVRVGVTPRERASIKKTIREHFKGTYIAAGGFDRASAEKILDSKDADLVAFGRPFLANPDLVARLEHGWELASADMSKAYTPGPAGCIDYPTQSA